MFAIEEDLHLATDLGDFISLGLQLVAINILIVNAFWSTSKEQESLWLHPPWKWNSPYTGQATVRSFPTSNPENHSAETYGGE
jgi:hypothetical protein